MKIYTQNIACSQRQMYTCIHHSVIHYDHTERELELENFIFQGLSRETERECICKSPYIHTCTCRPCVLHYYDTTQGESCISPHIHTSTRRTCVLHYCHNNEVPLFQSRQTCSEQTLETEDMPLPKISVHALKWIMPHASWGWVDRARLSCNNLGYCPTHDHQLSNSWSSTVWLTTIYTPTHNHQLLSNSLSSTVRLTIIYTVRHAAIIYGPTHDHLCVRHAII